MSAAPAIVLAAFGASSPLARQAYQAIEANVRAALPQYEIVWAYLSRRIVESQRQQGVYLPTLEETYADLAARGFRSAVVQPLLIAPGEEYHNLKIVRHNGLQLYYGAALLEGEEAVKDALDAIAHHVEPGVPNVLVCHGNRTYSHFNVQLLELQKLARQRFENLLVASIEGEPGETPLDEARELARASGEVVFIPFMMVTGEHISSDVMGDTPDSWRNRVGAARSICRSALAENSKIHRIFLGRIQAVLQLAQKEGGHV
jgi:sirohydrochlorin cobaltochelatase